MKLKKNVKLALVDIIEFILILLLLKAKIPYDTRELFIMLIISGIIAIRWCFYKEIL